MPRPEGVTVTAEAPEGMNVETDTVSDNAYPFTLKSREGYPLQFVPHWDIFFFCPKSLEPRISANRRARREPSGGGGGPRARRSPSRLQAPASPTTAPDSGVALRIPPCTVVGRLKVSSNKQPLSPSPLRAAMTTLPETGSATRAPTAGPPLAHAPG